MRATHHTILGYKGIIRGAEIDEPVPIFRSPQKQRHGVERGGEHRRTSVGHQARFLHHPHVPDLGEHGVSGDEPGQLPVLRRRRVRVQVDQVVVPGVVERVHQTAQPRHVASGGGDQVGERDRILAGAGADEDGGGGAVVGELGGDEEQEQEKRSGDEADPEELSGSHCCG